MCVRKSFFACAAIMLLSRGLCAIKAENYLKKDDD